jgi:uncharacterized protein
MRNAILLIILLANISLLAQEKSGGEITSEGKATLKVKPDVAVFIISISKEKEIEKLALKDLTFDTDKVSQLLLKIGFSKDNIRITDYGLKINQFQNQKKKYEANNNLIVTFGLDNSLIDAFYSELQNSNFSDVSVEFETRISVDLELKIKAQLVKMAIENAKANAENIAKALNVKLNGIKHVSKYGNDLRSYVISSNNTGVSGMSLYMPNPKKTIFEKYEVLEKELEETINIVYEIVKI